MLGILKKTDIDQAQQDLQTRRREILARHAKESQSLDAEGAELDTLNDLIEDFAQKFMTTVIFAQKAVAAPVGVPVVARVAAPVVHQNLVSKAPVVAANHRPRAYHMSNFAEYTRAMARV